MARPVVRCSSTRAAVRTWRGPSRLDRSTSSATRRDGPAGGRHHVDVAETPVRLLQVGLEQEGHVAVGPVALVDLVGQDGQPVRRPWARQRSRARASSGADHVGVAGHQAAVEQTELGPQVLGRHLQDLAPAAGPSGRAGPPRPTPGTRRRRPRRRRPRRRSWTRTTSRSLPGASSPRP